MKRKAVLFDLDGTLWDRDAAVQALLVRQYECFSHDLSHILPTDYVTQIMALEANGSADKMAVYRAFGEQHALPVVLLDRLHVDFWTRYGQYLHPFPEVRNVLKQLRDADVSTGIITNGTVSIQEAKIGALGLLEQMDVAGAQGVGLQAVWRSSNAWPPPVGPCATISTLDELLPMVLPHSRTS